MWCVRDRRPRVICDGNTQGGKDGPQPPAGIWGPRARLAGRGPQPGARGGAGGTLDDEVTPIMGRSRTGRKLGIFKGGLTLVKGGGRQCMPAMGEGWTKGPESDATESTATSVVHKIQRKKKRREGKIGGMVRRTLHRCMAGGALDFHPHRTEGGGSSPSSALTTRRAATVRRQWRRGALLWLSNGGRVRRGGGTPRVGGSVPAGATGGLRVVRREEIMDSNETCVGFGRPRILLKQTMDHGGKYFPQPENFAFNSEKKFQSGGVAIQRSLKGQKC